MIQGRSVQDGMLQRHREGVKKRPLIPTLRLENLADISTECFRLHGESEE